MATKQASLIIDHLRRTVLYSGDAGLTDGQLLANFIDRRDATAFATLVRRHGPMVWGVCRRMLDHHDAEDAFQAAFLVLVRKAACIVPRENVANWLYGVAHQTALQARRTAARRRTKERPVTTMPEPVAPPQDVWHEARTLLDQELSRLPDRYRMMIILCDLEGKPRKEVARQCGLPEGTVGSRLARARMMLAKRLTRRGVVLSVGVLTSVLSEEATAASLPISVFHATLQAGSRLAIGSVRGTSSARVVALVEGVIKTMFVSKSKTMMLLAGGFMAAVLGVSVFQAAARPSHQQNDTLAALFSDDAEGTRTKATHAHYCRFIFGKNSHARVLVRLQGKELAIDRDGHGRFNNEGDQFKLGKDLKGVTIIDPDSKTTYMITGVEDMHLTPPDKGLYVHVHIKGRSYALWAGVILSADSKHVPEVHFDGPFTITPMGSRIVNRARYVLENSLVNLGGLVPNFIADLAGKKFVDDDPGFPPVLKRGEATRCFADVRTPDDDNYGVGIGSTDDRDGEKPPFPRVIHPMVRVEFPPQRSGAPLIKKQFPMRFVRVSLFAADIVVPKEAGPGKARLTFSFDACKAVKVAPSTVEIPIEDPKGF